MRMTIEIADPLLARVRRIAEHEGTTLRALVEEGLRRVLDERTHGTPFRLRDASFKGPCRGLTREFATGGWERIRRTIHGDDT